MTTSPITLGPYTTGEIPFLVRYQFLDDQGAALDLSGFTAKLVSKRRGGEELEPTNATVANGVEGLVDFAVVCDQPGTWDAELWVGNGTNRLASIKYVYEVLPSVGEVPDI